MSKGEQLQRRKIVDEFGDLDVELAPLKPKLKRYDELAAVIRSWHANDAPGVSVIIPGDRHTAFLGPRGFQTKISDMPGVFKAMGKDAFLKACSITLKVLEEAKLAPASFTVKEQSGPRSIHVRRDDSAKSAQLKAAA